jgi:metallo-beta-lactamase family protein
MRRIDPNKVARRDWHNDLSALILDIRDQLEEAADEKRSSGDHSTPPAHA